MEQKREIFMEGVKITLSAIWIAMMLTYLIGDVLRIFAGVFFLFNAVGIPGYPGLYDKVLFSVSLVMNLMVIWFAWKCV